ncbi:hypothetical protein [Hahella ganghwensis]|uniref:hypothetical protein n=1 Tax=Hahella ganghwensis TaxID=286420 RepID=UPI000381C2DE|nr:hypothetical protein [Hahella ganghwensis]
MKRSFTPLIALLLAGKTLASDSALEQFNDHIMLGAAVNTQKQEVSSLICVTERGAIRSLPPREAKFEDRSDLSYTSLEKELGVSGSFSYDGYVNLDVSGGFLKAAAKGELEKTHVKRFTIYGKSRTFTGGNDVLISDKCQEYSEKYQHAPAKLASRVGDAFVSKIHYGASFYSALKVKFATRWDYKKYSGDVSFNGGKVKLSSKLMSANKDIKRRTSVTFTVHQSGGAADSNILSTLPAHSVSCTVENLQRCTDFMNEVAEYVSTEFLGNEQPDSFYNVLGYAITSYSSYGLTDLVAPEGNILVANEVKVARQNLEARLKVEREAGDRAANILKYATASLSNEDASHLRDVVRGAQKNTVMIGSILKSCQDDPYRKTEGGLNYCSELYRVASGLSPLPAESSAEYAHFRRFDDYYNNHKPLISAVVRNGNQFDLQSIGFHFTRGRVSSVDMVAHFQSDSPTLRVTVTGTNLATCELYPFGPVIKNEKNSWEHKLGEILYPANNRPRTFEVDMSKMTFAPRQSAFNLWCFDLNGAHAISSREDMFQFAAKLEESGTSGKRRSHNKKEYAVSLYNPSKVRVAYHSSSFAGWRSKMVGKNHRRCYHRQNITDTLYDTKGDQVHKVTRRNFENGISADVKWRWYESSHKCSWKWANKYEPYRNPPYIPAYKLVKQYQNQQ